jgi:dephospho-CoA kinase
MMLVAGLTGSIGMGKSAVAAMLRARAIPVFDADAEVHRLYAGEAVPLIEAAFPGTTAEGRVDRTRLAARLADDTTRFATLERIVHPLVQKAERQFLNDARRQDAAIAVLEIPLLFETGRNAHVDAVIVVSASADVQRARVLARPGVSADRLDALLARQVPDIEKRRQADFVVDTGTSFADTEAQVDRLVAALKVRPATAFERHWRGT